MASVQRQGTWALSCSSAFAPVRASAVAADPISTVEAHPDRHAKIPTPKDIYMDRQNSLGRDYSQAADRERHAIAAQGTVAAR